MKKLQRYVLLSTAKAFIPAFAALSLLMLAGFCMQLLRDGLDVARLTSMLPPLFAYSVPLVLPSALLTAVILTFGRLTADNELIAVRAAGVHVFSIMYPVLMAALVLSVVASCFQFELVPRARRSISALKYAALKQVLLDHAALSWKRRFSFDDLHIVYADYVDGRMEDVVVLETRGQQPYRLLTAQSCVVYPHESQDELIVFRANDCVVTRFSPEDYGEPLSWTNEYFRYFLRVGPGAEEIRGRSKHLALRSLVQEWRQLSQSVSRQPLLDDPRAVAKDNKKRRDRLDAEIANYDRNLEGRLSEYEEHANRTPKALQEKIDSDRELIESERQSIAEMQRRLEEIQEGEGDQEQAALLAQIKEGNRSTEARQVDIAKAEQEIVAARLAARGLKIEIDALQSIRDELAESRAEVYLTIKRAADQNDLAAIGSRAHKRLAQALSVFVFALVGIPLGIVASRRSVMIAFGISFAIVLFVFYPSLIIGQIVAEAGLVPAGPALWAGNAFTFVIGAALTVHVVRR